MESFNEDLALRSSQSDTKIKFLQQIKECQYRLQCIEKLFFDLQKMPENENHFKKSHSSLNDINEPTNKKSKLSSSFPDLQLLMQEFENIMNSKNNLSKESDSPRSGKQTPLNVNVESVNNNDSSSPLTFVIQVPNSILSLLKKQISNDHFSDFSSQCSTGDILKSRKRTRFISFLQKLFKKRKSDVLSTANSDISEKIKVLHFHSEKNAENLFKSFSNSNPSNLSNLNYKPVIKDIHVLGKNTIGENSTNIEVGSRTNNSKEKQTLIFPITYNFDEKSSMNVKPNITIHHEIMPETNSHSIKIANEIPTQNLKKSSDEPLEHVKLQVENSKKEELQSMEILLEILIKTLIKTTEKLNDLETIKSYMENLIDKDKELKTRKSKQDKHFKHRNSKETVALVHLMQHIMAHMENSKNKPKLSEKTEQQIPKRQSSKLSVCSSPGESNDEEFYKTPITKKPSYIQRRVRLQSPSRLNYLVCQSERDIDYKIN